MSQVVGSAVGGWTAVDLVERFGAIPLNRVRQEPVPGSATEQDVIEIREHEDRLYELVDGTLVEKTVGAYESYLSGVMVHLLWSFLKKNDLGIVLPADGMMRLAPGLVRIPDISFISWQRLPEHRPPRKPIPDLAPDLAVEVISKFNTRQEMERKLQDYFSAGVRLVWYVYHSPHREVRVYVSATECSVVREAETLDGGEVLPGFRNCLRSLPGRRSRDAPRPTRQVTRSPLLQARVIKKAAGRVLDGTYIFDDQAKQNASITRILGRNTHR